MHAAGAVVLSLLATLTIARAQARGSHPEYAAAPATPLCEPGPPLLCAWSGALDPPPDKYAVEAVAGYDPGCSHYNDFQAQFSFTTPDAAALIEIPVAALDTVLCPTQDDPCSAPATVHAASVQIRVKALDPPARNGAQNNPFSAFSAPVTIPGVCAAACPQACADGVDVLLAQLTAAQQQSGVTSSLSCSYDSYWQAGAISYGGYTPTGVLPVVQGSALIGVAYCLASVNNNELVDMGLQSTEQAACATRYAPAFAALAGQACNVAAP